MSRPKIHPGLGRAIKAPEAHIAKSPCWPPYGVVWFYPDGLELWDCDVASGSEAATAEAFEDTYGDDQLILWSDPRHYSNCKAEVRP